MKHVWLGLDPETSRVTMRDQPFDELPRGLRGRGWVFREADIPERDWGGIVSGIYTDDEVDYIHRTAWSQNGDTPWPSP